MPGSDPGDEEANIRAMEARQDAAEAHPGTREVSVCRPMLQSCNLYNLCQFDEDLDPHKKPDTYSHCKNT